METMEAFEDENPFESEPARIRSPHSDSSSSRIDISGMSSPEIGSHSATLRSPPTSPSRRSAFPSPGSHRQPQVNKSDFCCGRDHWLHSGEDVEILVSPLPCQRVSTFGHLYATPALDADH